MLNVNVSVLLKIIKKII